MKQFFDANGNEIGYELNDYDRGLMYVVMGISIPIIYTYFGIRYVSSYALSFFY